ncbi:hypothetical protein GBA52_014814 [Prunus armeniaca]|nr:hypothetical protein GBA52_014814 [Prunus armeniaca]
MQDNSNKEASKKKTRGKTKLLILTKEKTKGSRVVVELNLANQPFRDNAARFSSFLGITARELVPITLKSWKDMSENFINQTWEHVTQQFNLDDCHKKYTFRKLCKLWRDHRSHLVKIVMKQAQVVGQPRVASLLKPDNVKTMDE